MRRAVLTAVAAMALLGSASPPALLFNASFTGKSIDTKTWYRCYPQYDEIDGCSNNGTEELEWYQPDNVEVAGGKLLLVARPAGPGIKNHTYTSGMVSTGGSPLSHPSFAFRYGYAEIDAMMPGGAGMWPTFWMLAADRSYPPEIDAAEYQGVHPTIDVVSVYWRDASGRMRGHSTAIDTGLDLSAGFHRFGVDWEPDHLAWYVDGREIERVSDPSAIPRQPLYILLNLAVGGWAPGQLKADAARFPAAFVIRYVRVWNRRP
jgi:beta-glucanase (GH16 family)